MSMVGKKNQCQLNLKIYKVFVVYITNNTLYRIIDHDLHQYLKMSYYNEIVRFMKFKKLSRFRKKKNDARAIKLGQRHISK